MGGWRFGSECLYVLLFVCGGADSSGSILSWSALTFCFVALLSRQHAVNSDSQTPSDNFLENTNRLWSSLLELNGVHSREFRSYWDIRLFKMYFIWAINMACGLSLYIWEEVMSPLNSGYWTRPWEIIMYFCRWTGPGMMDIGSLSTILQSNI